MKEDKIVNGYYESKIKTLRNENNRGTIKYVNYQIMTDRLETNWKELKKFIEKEKDRLVKECSQIYYDSFDRLNRVNADIYDELKNISDKMQELESDKNGC